MIRVILIVLTITVLISCSGDKPKKQEQQNPAAGDTLARPNDVGEHKSIHQEEWEHYRSDTAGVR